MKKHTSILRSVFWIIVAADIMGIATHNTVLHYFAKPLLLPALMVLLLAAVTATPGKKLLLAALFFSWLGDMFLLFEDKNALFFIAGLASFLTTHILYIVYFSGIRGNAVSLLKKQPWLVAAVLLYGISLVWLLFPYLGGLKIPVILYAAVICTMLLYSLHIFYNIRKPAAKRFTTGAVLFVLSDSLLALNKFYTPIPLAGIWIMTTYCAAQYFIVNGYIIQHDKN